MTNSVRRTFQKISAVLIAIIKEPLLQFLVIGALIFAASEITADWKDMRHRTIVVDKNVEDHLKSLYNVQFGTDPDAATFRHMVHDYISDEVMYREALRMGLAEQDEIIRRRLVQKMKFLLQDSSDIPDPGTAVLKRFYTEHAAGFTRPARVSFRHLYFNNDGARTPDARQRAGEALHLILSGQEQQALKVTDKFPLDDRYTELTRRGARKLFGDTDFVASLFKAPVGVWSGPVQSGYGWHLVMVQDRVDKRIRPFIEVRDQVLRKWRDEVRERNYNKRVKKLIDEYKVQYIDVDALK